MKLTDMHPIEEVLRVGTGETKLGLVLVVASDRGVAAILLGSDQQQLLREAGSSFTDARLIEDQEGLAEIVAKVVTLINMPHLAPDFALDLRGSALELAVWDVLRQIPPGETRSYGTLARKLPILATAQDVGAACAANRLAVAIPCHRVVKANGSISGYRWGVHRKRRLINMEGII
jgi:AraC family transcriptional regulator of adaptative response/methylated-DNA-[protein]-cysteine methyltransferase